MLVQFLKITWYTINYAIIPSLILQPASLNPNWWCRCKSRRWRYFVVSMVVCFFAFALFCQRWRSFVPSFGLSFPHQSAIPVICVTSISFIVGSRPSQESTEAIYPWSETALFVCFPLSLGNISECSNLKRCKSDQSCGVEISMVSKNTFTFLVQQIWEKQLKLKLAPSQETLFLSCGNATRPPTA